MSEIKRGDLVMVVVPPQCCGYDVSIGHIFKVDGIRGEVTQSCNYCKQLQTAIAVSGHPWGLTQAYRLKKIDPPATGETREAYVNLPKEVTV